MFFKKINFQIKLIRKNINRNCKKRRKMYYKNINYMGQNYNQKQEDSKSNDFEILKKLGQGSFGSVFKVRRKCDNEIYAMKKVKLFMLSEKERLNALNEVRILASIKDKNIVSYKDAFFDENSKELCIIMEFASEGSIEFIFFFYYLKKRVKSIKKNYFNFYSI